jgi:hypothetical protein
MIVPKMHDSPKGYRVADYRLYCIRNGHFYHCEEIAAVDDAAAIAEAERRQPYVASELWTGARRVKILEREDAALSLRPSREAVI